MVIAFLAPPFIPVPPLHHGGTELFIARLAEALGRLGHEVVVYANGESTVKCQVRWLYDKKDWPLDPQANGMLKNLNHTAWAIRDVMDEDFDIIHFNDALAVPFSPLARDRILRSKWRNGPGSL